MRIHCVLFWIGVKSVIRQSPYYIKRFSVNLPAIAFENDHAFVLIVFDTFREGSDHLF